MNLTKVCDRTNLVLNPLINEMVQLVSKIANITNQIAMENCFIKNQTIIKVMKRVSKGIVENAPPDFSKNEKLYQIFEHSTIFSNQSDSYFKIQNFAIKEKLSRAKVFEKFLEAMILEGSRDLRDSCLDKWLNKATREHHDSLSFIPDSDWCVLGKTFLKNLIPKHPIDSCKLLTSMIEIYEDPNQECLIYFNDLCQLFHKRDRNKNSELLESLTWITKKILEKYSIQNEQKKELEVSLSIVINSLKGSSLESEASILRKLASQKGLEVRKMPVVPNSKQKELMAKFKKSIDAYKRLKKGNSRKENISDLSTALEFLKSMNPSQGKLWNEIIDLINSCKNSDIKQRVWGYFKASWEKNLFVFDADVADIWIKLLNSKIIPEEKVLFSFFNNPQNQVSLRNLFSDINTQKQKIEFYNILMKKAIDYIKRDNKQIIKDEIIFADCCKIFIECLHNSKNLIDKKIKPDLVETVLELLKIVKDPKNSINAELKILLISLFIETSSHGLHRNSYTLWTNYFNNFELDLANEKVLQLFISWLPAYNKSNSEFIVVLFYKLFPKLTDEQIDKFCILLDEQSDREKFSWAWTKIIEIKFQRCLTYKNEQEFEDHFLSNFNFFKNHYSFIGFGNSIVAEAMVLTCLDGYIKFKSKDMFLKLFNELRSFYRDEFSQQKGYYRIIENEKENPIVFGMITSLYKHQKIYQEESIFLALQACEIFLENYNNILQHKQPDEETIYYLELILNSLFQFDWDWVSNEVIDKTFEILSLPLCKALYEKLLIKMGNRDFGRILNTIIIRKFKEVYKQKDVGNYYEKLRQVYNFFNDCKDPLIIFQACEENTVLEAFQASINILKHLNNKILFQKINAKLQSIFIYNFPLPIRCPYTERILEPFELITSILKIYTNELVKANEDSPVLEIFPYLLEHISLIISKSDFKNKFLIIDQLMNLLIIKEDLFEKHFSSVKDVICLGLDEGVYEEYHGLYLRHRNQLQLIKMLTDCKQDLPPHVYNNYNDNLFGLEILIDQYIATKESRFVIKACTLLVHKYFEGFVFGLDDAKRIYEKLFQASFNSSDPKEYIELIKLLLGTANLDVNYADIFVFVINSFIEKFSNKIFKFLLEKQMKEFVEDFVRVGILKFKEKGTINNTICFSALDNLIQFLSNFSYNESLIEFSKFYERINLEDYLISQEMKVALAKNFLNWLKAIHLFYKDYITVSPLDLIGGTEQFEKIFEGLGDYKSEALKYISLISKT